MHNYFVIECIHCATTDTINKNVCNQLKWSAMCFEKN